MVIVPSWETYERQRWPSRSNPDHKTSWVLQQADQSTLHQEALLDIIPPKFRLIRALTLDEGFDPTSDRDQTADSTCECGLEGVWQREAA